MAIMLNNNKNSSLKLNSQNILKIFLSTFLFIFLYASFIQAEENKTVCLNMIVKNESAVIKRCLSSLKPLIDYWVIVDTGSTDGTQDIIKGFMKDIPGELHEQPWVNFAHNRNGALELAKGKADYVLFIDADEILKFDSDFKLPELDKDFYYIQTNFSNTVYNRLQLINNHLEWKWSGALHETVQPAIPTANYEVLAGVTNVVHTDGCRSQDPRKFQKDAELLENLLTENPNDTRNVFYLAQSYKDCEMYEQALKNYKRRVDMGGWDQEVFWSMLQIGSIQEALKQDPQTIINSYLQAFFYRPTRAEPLYRLAQYYRLSNDYIMGYQIASQGLTLKDNQDVLFVEKWVYDYGLLLEFSICAYWIGNYKEALLASQLMLADPNLPQNVRECVEKNLIWIYAKIKENSPFINNYFQIVPRNKEKDNTND